MSQKDGKTQLFIVTNDVKKCFSRFSGIMESICTVKLLCIFDSLSVKTLYKTNSYNNCVCPTYFYLKGNVSEVVHMCLWKTFEKNTPEVEKCRETSDCLNDHFKPNPTVTDTKNKGCYAVCIHPTLCGTWNMILTVVGGDKVNIFPTLWQCVALLSKIVPANSILGYY